MVIKFHPDYFPLLHYLNVTESFVVSELLKKVTSVCSNLFPRPYAAFHILIGFQTILSILIFHMPQMSGINYGRENQIKENVHPPIYSIRPKASSIFNIIDIEDLKLLTRFQVQLSQVPV